MITYLCEETTRGLEMTYSISESNHVFGHLMLDTGDMLVTSGHSNISGTETNQQENNEIK